MLALLSALTLTAAPALMGPAHAKPRLILEAPGAAPGQTVTAAVVFDIDPKWHVYYDGQNDTGQPPTFEREKLPADLTFGEFLWPAPHRQELEGGIVDHIYEKRVVLLLPVAVAKTAKPGTEVRFELALSWMECATICQLGEKKVSGVIKVLDPASKPAAAGDAKVVEEARKALPGPLPADGSVKVETAGSMLTVTAKGAERVTFIPFRESAPLAHLAAEGTAKGEVLKAELKAVGGVFPVVGIVQVERGGTTASYALDTRPKSKQGAPKSPKPDQGTPAGGTTPSR